MYFHASPIGGIEYLVPKVSEHHIPLVYFSTKRENTLVYLSNAIEKYCRETGYRYDGIWKKWGPYGFTLNDKACGLSVKVRLGCFCVLTDEDRRKYCERVTASTLTCDLRYDSFSGGFYAKQ